MAEYNIRELQLRILETLKAVDNVCREHNLRYYIWAGTMIGAVRHKGFIPWDDDLDIAMPRPDYDRLIEHAAEWLPKPYEMVCAENDGVIGLGVGGLFCLGLGGEAEAGGAGSGGTEEGGLEKTAAAHIGMRHC